MLTSRQRAYLRGLAHKEDAVVQIGKFGLTPEVTKAVDEALEARELVKVSVLNNSMLDPLETAEILNERTRSQIVSVTGGKIVLYRKPNPNSIKKVIIELPK